MVGISDEHFYHPGIISYCERPENYEELITQSYKVFKDDDIICHLGDFTFKPGIGPNLRELGARGTHTQ